LKRFKTVIIGCGTIAERKHILSALKLPEINLIALVDQNVERARALSQRFGVKAYYKDFRDILDQVEMAIVATPNSLHSEISCACLEKGIHVLCEKPMATSVAECESMIKAGQSGNAKLMVGHYMRYTSNVRIAREFLNERILNGIREIECSFGHRFYWPSVTNFYAFFDLSGGGVLMDYGAHLVDLIYWMTKQDIARLRYRVNDPDISKIEKDVEVKFELTGRVECRMTLSRTRKLPNILQIIGNDGWLKVHLDNYQDVEFYKHGSKLSTDDEPISIIGEKCDPYSEQLEDLIRSINEDTSHTASGFDGLRTLRFVEACYNSLSNKN